jgi:hypothetical protein
MLQNAARRLLRPFLTFGCSKPISDKLQAAPQTQYVTSPRRAEQEVGKREVCGVESFCPAVRVVLLLIWSSRPVAILVNLSCGYFGQAVRWIFWSGRPVVNLVKPSCC